MTLDTVDQVTAAIRVLREVDPAEFRRLKPTQKRARAAQLAELYERRARMWAELAAAVHAGDTIPRAYASACVTAQMADEDEVKWWRGQASAR